MINTRTLRVASVVTLGAAAVLASAFALPAQATSYVGSYGNWTDATIANDLSGGTAAVNFGSTGLPSAAVTVEFTPDQANDVYTSDSSDEYLAAETPIGAVFGASGPSADNTFFKTVMGPGNTATVTITFDTVFPADRLGLAIGDLDEDSVSVAATDADGNALTGTELIGSSTTNGFNLCDVTADSPSICSGETDVPTVSTNANDVTFTGVSGADVGVTGWIQPSVAVKELTITVTNDQNVANSSVRYWLAGLSEATSDPAAPSGSDSLATTGSMGSATATLAAGLAVLGATGLAFSRRRARA